MTFLNIFSRADAASVPARTDNSVAAIVFMLALVFVPVLGMHIAVAAYGSEAASVAQAPVADSVATLLRLGHGSPG